MKGFRIFKYLFICFIVVGCVILGDLGIKGYKIYEEAITTLSIEEAVEKIRDGETFVDIETIDKDFLNGVVAVEDHRFYEHGAVDAIGIVRALLTNVIKGELVQGGSTITQQLAKNMYFTHEQTLTRKVAELMVAVDLEEKYSKEEILELYVNGIYFGNGCYGIGEASEHFLGKAPEDLTIEEAALLAGLPQSPSRYAKDEALASKRQQIVLLAMKENGYYE